MSSQGWIIVINNQTQLYFFINPFGEHYTYHVYISRFTLIHFLKSLTFIHSNYSLHWEVLMELLLEILMNVALLQWKQMGPVLIIV
jgi:hypothetical protein